MTYSHQCLWHRAATTGRALVFMLGAGAIALMPASHAMAAPEGTLDSMSLDLGTGISGGLTVQSTNGANWTVLKDSEVSLSGSLKIEMKHGRIKAFGIYLGTCSEHACFEQVGTPLLGSIHLDPPYVKSIDGTTSFSFSSLKLGVSTTGIAVPAFGDEIIARCNAGLSQGENIHEGFDFTHTVPMTLGADTRMWDSFQFGSAGTNFVLGNEPLDDVDSDKTVDVEIPVVCEGVPLPQVGATLPPYELIAATLHGDPAEYAGACPVDLKLFMSATSNIVGPFEARVEAKSGWKSKPYSLQTSEADDDGTWSKHFQDTLTIPIVNQSTGFGAINTADGIGQFGTPPAQPDDTFPGGGVSMPDQVQTGYQPGNLHEDSLRLVVSGGGKTVTTDWWKYKVTCDPKKTPEVSDTPQGLGQTVFIKQAALTLIPHAPQNGSKCGLTVSGYIQTNVKNVNVTFRLKNHQGNTTNAQTIKTWHANNIGKFVEYIDFSTSGQGVWVSQDGGWALPGAGAGSQAGPKQGSLQIVVENPATFEGNVASYDFTCHDPAPAGLQQVPTVKVDPDLPKGPGSAVGKPRPQTAEPGKKVKPQVPGTVTVMPLPKVDVPLPKITCSGGQVKSGECACGKGMKPVKAGPSAFRCIEVPKIVIPLPTISCAGGRVNNGTCVCGKGMKPVKAGPSAFRCIKVAVPTTKTPSPARTTSSSSPTPKIKTLSPQKISCLGGVVRSGRCTCPNGKPAVNGSCKLSTLR